MIGKTISHYKILEKLGKGGMGIVYKAEDTKLKRTVALKFLNQNLGTEDDKKRFHREAQAAATLNHPNIATIFEIDESDGRTFIVMEYVEGRNLTEMVRAKGGSPLPLDVAINYSIQIAVSLYAAHQQGVVHRDIKSANVMVTNEGLVKVLDFGLAKLASGTGLTKTGSTLGTAAYMSPEQAKGIKVDQRTDIWSLGVLMYEMITGQLPFKGEYDQAVTYAILNEEPEPMTALRTGVPIEMDGIISKALAKDRDVRYQHVDEIPAELKAIDLSSTRTSQISRRAVSGSVIQQPAIKQKRIDWKLVAPFLMVALIMSFIAGWFLRPRSEPESKTVRMVTHSLSMDQTLRPVRLAISPDGTMMVYGVVTENVVKLHLKRFDQFGVTTINDPQAAYPFFSPDSRELCFHDGKLKKVFIDGGTAQTLFDATIYNYTGGTWGDDDTIIFASPTGLQSVSPSGGIPEVVLADDSGKGAYRFPAMLPGSKAMLYTAWEGRTYDDAIIAVYSLETGKSETLIEGGTNPLYSRTGHILFGRSGSCWAVPFDLKQLKITGREIPVLEGIDITGWGYAHFRVSENGTLVYVSEFRSRGDRTLVLVDRNGMETSLTDRKRPYYCPRFSPDGLRVAITIAEERNINIWIHDVVRDTQDPLTLRGCRAKSQTSWNPDGTRISFTAHRSGWNPRIFWKRADGIEEAERLLPYGDYQWGGTWSDDGTLFAFYEDPPTGRNIWAYTTRDSIARVFLNQPYNEFAPAVSPNGKWIAYISDQTGQDQIYITPYPGPGLVTSVSTLGGREPVWAPGGRELFYRDGDKMMVVAVETQPSLKLGMPELLFQKPFLSHRFTPQYDIHPDGDRFLMVKEDVEVERGQIKIIFNWFEVLKEKMALAQK